MAMSLAIPLTPPPINVGSGFLVTRAQTELNLRMESATLILIPNGIDNPPRMKA
jgi:hypothetical protein